VHEIRSDVVASIERVAVDEGQMVAEDDVIAVLRSGDREIVVATEVPGVVRELHVDAGSVVVPGALIALIDES
jgi:acetyl-CoA carboxylase biotin carboxyl carrier protein